MTERDGEHVPRRAPERGASLVCRVATRICALLEAARLVPPAGFALVERAAP
jgi:hypothetical protein